MKNKVLTATAFAMLFGLAQSNATQTVRETWDSFVPGDTPLGQLTGSKTAVGFDPVKWVVNSNSPIFSVDNNSDNWSPGLPPNMGFGAGNIWSDIYITQGGNPYYGGLQDYQDPRSWAVRQLTTNAQINFNANGTYYFSIQLVHGNDGMQGMGFANATNDSARFVGAGITRATYSSTRFPSDLGSTLYISSGTLGQAGDPGDYTYNGVYPVEGPAMVMAYATNAVGSITPNGNPGLLAGMLTTTVGGNTTLRASWFANAATVPTDPGTITWDVTYDFPETTTMTHLLIWDTASSYNNSIDAIRVADSWGEVVGVESRISISPTNVVPTGQTVVFSSFANPPWSAPTYQWLSNNVPILNETNAVYTNTYPTATALYTLIVSNSYGLSTNNPQILLTVLPPAGPGVSGISGAESRYVGGTLALAAQISGTPPITLTWTQNGNLLTAQTNSTLTLNSVQLTNAGTYILHASNPYGDAYATNVLSVVTPSSYVAAIIAQQPYAHYDLSETGVADNTALHDLAGGHDGVAKDTNVVLGVTGPYYTGFGSMHSGVGSARNAPAGSRIDIPIMSYGSNMTICAWVRGANMNNSIVMGCAGTGWGISGDGNPYYGLYFPSSSTLGSQWGAAATSFNSSLIVPANEWTFVALVITPTDTTIYMGHPPEALTSAQTAAENGASTVAINPNEGSTIGRIDYAWAGPGNSWSGSYGDFSSVSVFYSSLSETAITNIYAAAGQPVSTVLNAATDNTGSVVLTWPTGATLEQASDLTGPWSAVPSPTAWFIVPPSPYKIDATNVLENPYMFYRTSQ